MPQIFTYKEKEELKQNMLDIGFEMIKEYGMIHASVEKVTKAVNIGRTTFYNFFPTKEKFIYDIIIHQREKAEIALKEKLAGRSRMTLPEAKDYFRDLLSGEDTIYRYLTTEDELKLQKKLPEEFKLDITSEAENIHGILQYMEGVRSEIDFQTVANMMKVIALTQESKDMLHTEALPATLDTLFQALFSLLFEEK